MTINRVRPLGWVTEGELTSAELNALDARGEACLDKSAAGDTLLGVVQLQNAGRIAHAVYTFPDANETIVPGNSNTIVEIPGTLTNNRTMTLSATGAVSGDTISVFAYPELTRRVTVTFDGATYAIGNADSDDGPWATFLFAAGAWRLLQSARGTRMRRVEVTSSGEFVVPRGVTQLLLHGWGGGGAGGKCGVGNVPPSGSGSSLRVTTSGAGAGGGGALARWQSVIVQSEQAISVIIGAGGTSASKNGGDTTFGNMARFRGARGGSDGRSASSIQSDKTTVSRPGMPYEFWYSARGDEFQVPLSDVYTSWNKPPQSGGVGGFVDELPSPYALVSGEFGQDSAEHKAGRPGYYGGGIINFYGGGGGGGAGPGGDGGNGGDSLFLEINQQWAGGQGGSGAINSGAGGGGAGGCVNDSYQALGGNGGSGKLVIHYVK